MDFKKTNAPTNTVTRNLNDFSKDTGNVYESVVIIGKRANQIAIEEKKELHKKIEEFSNNNDGIDEYYENREQIDVVRRFEQMPKPTLVATEEYLEHQLYYRNPAKEDKEQQRMEELENSVIAEQEMN